MAIGNTIGEFSFASSGITVSAGADGGVAHAVNFEGTASGFGAVIGTLTFHAASADAKSGTTTWIGSAYLDDGERRGGTGSGIFEEAGTHRWRVRALIQISDGSVLLSDGIVALDGRSYQGTLHEWN